jgi:hypothetical protein
MSGMAPPPDYGPVDEWLEESLARVEQPAFKRLASLLRVSLPLELSAIFETASTLYNARGTGTPFDEVRERAGEDLARLFYELLTMGFKRVCEEPSTT